MVIEAATAIGGVAVVRFLYRECRIRSLAWWIAAWALWKGPHGTIRGTRRDLALYLLAVRLWYYGGAGWFDVTRALQNAVRGGLVV
jgi:hypothetical protein